MPKIFTDKIQQRFSASAQEYDRFSGLHREIADKLIEEAAGIFGALAILDVGCGTGYLTVKAKERFVRSEVVGLDFSPDMLEIARAKHDGIDWVLADCRHLPFADGHFDTVISNLAYQWAGDLSLPWAEARRVLVPGGGMACTLFGYHTCQELFQSLSEARSGALQFTRLPNESELRRSLAASGFREFDVKVETVRREFNDMQALITWLKSIGANNLPRQGYVGKETLSSASAIYREKFSLGQGVGATFEVIWVYAKK